MALLDILGCAMDDLIKPVAASPARQPADGGGTLPDRRSARARITGISQ